jgi:peptidoglycan/LPS O-acetylase OafA/YrhL
VTLSVFGKSARGADTLVEPVLPHVGLAQGHASRHFETLDALRGVAALAVLLLHTNYYLWPSLARSAYLAVDFFFVLSGFVVAYAYDGKLAGGLPVARFLKLRMVRIYPLHLAGLLIAAVVLAPADFHLPAVAVALALVVGGLFLPWPFASDPDHLFPLNPPAWSLFFEVIASLAYGLTHRWLSQRVLIAVVVAAGAALCLKAAVTGTIDGGVRWTTIEAGLARVFFSFPLGVLVYRWRAFIPAGLGAWGPWPILAVLFLLCLPTVPEPWRALYDLTFVALAAPLLVAAGTQASPSAAARPFFVALGAISFPLYVLHEPLRPWLLAAAERVGFEGPAAGLAYVVAIVGLAWLAAPLDAAVRRWLLGRSRKPANQPF